MTRNILLPLCRLRSSDWATIQVIGTSLHNLEQLYLDHHMQDNFDHIKRLVAGCPKMRILHLLQGCTLESAEHVLMGLPNLIEFKHPLMVLALEKIIRNGRADRISAIRNLHICDRSLRILGDSDVPKRNFGRFDETDVLKSAQMVIKHLNNITILDIILSFTSCEESLKNLSVTVCTMSQLTELTWLEYSGTDAIMSILEAVGHQLRLLDLCCKIDFGLDVIDQCRKLRVLRIDNKAWYQNESHDSDLLEQFTPFQHLQELHLTSLDHSHLKPALLKSLIASPVLQDLKLVWIPIFTDDIVKAAFNHVNHLGEKLTFTSLCKLVLIECDYISNYLEVFVTHERVPLESLGIEECFGITEEFLRNLERFDMTSKKIQLVLQ